MVQWLQVIRTLTRFLLALLGDAEAISFSHGTAAYPLLRVYQRSNGVFARLDVAQILSTRVQQPLSRWSYV